MSWDPNEPWGKKSDPVEAALKQVKTQFTDLFSSGGLKNLHPSGGARTIIIVGVLILLVWQSVFIVAPDEEGVVKRFGVPVRAADPGPHVKSPFVETVLQPKVEKLYRVVVGFRTNQQSRQQMVPQEALMLTGDMNILGIEFIVQFKIKEARDALRKTISKFISRFRYIEMKSPEGGKKLSEMTLGETDRLWDEAKTRGHVP